MSRYNLSVVLDNLKPDEAQQFLLHNMDVLELYTATNGVHTTQIDAILRNRMNPDGCRVTPKYECPRCRSNQISVFDRRRLGMCLACGEIWQRTSPDTNGFVSPLRSNTCTAEQNARNKSTYQPIIHFRDYLTRLCGLAIPNLNDAVYESIEERLAVKRLLRPDSTDPNLSEKTRRLNSHTMWFELLKHDLFVSSTGEKKDLSVYYHYIPYFHRLYSPAPRPPIFDSMERKRLTEAFTLVLRHKSTKHRFRDMGRKNLWSYGLMLARFCRIMGRDDVVYTCADMLKDTYSVPGVQLKAGQAWIETVDELKETLYKCLRWPYNHDPGTTFE